MGFLNKLFGTKSESGKCGKNLRWKLDGSGTLTISGKGEMQDYRCGIRSREAPAPWFNFSNSIKKIIIADGVTTIGDSAFFSCTKVTEVKLSNSVTKIGDGAFFYCWSLTEIKSLDGVMTIGNGAFGSCYSLTITIPDSVVDIGNGAFSGCESLKSITIPASVIKVGEGIFGACFLKEIHYPAGRGFEKNLSQGNNAKLIPYNVAPPVKPTTQSVTQPQPTAQPVAEKLTWSFAGKTLTVGGVREIKFFPYAQIPWLKHLHDIQRIVVGDGVEKIAAQAFKECKRLELVTLPASVKTIGDMFASVSFCGDRFVNGGRNVFWCLEDGVLVLKKNPVAVGDDFSTGFASWIFADKNIRGVKLEPGIKPTEKFFEWLSSHDSAAISFG